MSLLLQAQQQIVMRVTEQPIHGVGKICGVDWSHLGKAIKQSFNRVEKDASSNVPGLMPRMCSKQTRRVQRRSSDPRAPCRSEPASRVSKT